MLFRSGSVPLKYNSRTSEESEIERLVEEKLRKRLENVSNNNRNIIRCHNCGKEGHKVRECNKNRNNDNNERRAMKCYNCNKEGHMARDCKNPNRNSNAPTCTYCQRIGHTINECRKKQWNDQQRRYGNQRQNINRQENETNKTNESNEGQNQYLNDQSHL